jgi:hypothetical protein
MAKVELREESSFNQRGEKISFLRYLRRGSAKTERIGKRLTPQFMANALFVIAMISLCIIFAGSILLLLRR